MWEFTVLVVELCAYEKAMGETKEEDKESFCKVEMRQIRCGVNKVNLVKKCIDAPL